ncbi:MAG: NADH-quinone oxidoreductase subunit A [Cytophagales bacterium]
MNVLFLVSFLVLGLIFTASMLFLAKLLSKSKPNEIKLSIYENGEESVGENVISVNPKYLYIALMFVLFEVEIMLLFPWALAYVEISKHQLAWKLFALGEFTLFLFLLSVGLFYAWRIGAFDWGVKSAQAKKIVSVPKIYSDFNQSVK